MPNGTLLKPKTAHLTAYSTTEIFYPLTEWVPAMGIDKCTCVWRNSAVAALSTRVGYQTAEVRTDKPDAWAAIGTTQTTDNTGFCTTSTTISSGTASKYWVRFGAAYKSTGSFGEGDYSLQVSLDDWGTPIGTKTFQATSENNTSQYEAFTPWIPAQFADKVKMAIVASGFSNLTAQPAYQTATTLTDTADVWTTFDAATIADDEWCTGDETLTLTGKMWVRFGVEFHRTGVVAGTRGEGQITISTCIRTT
jgi:hypothetical protein